MALGPGRGEARQRGEGASVEFAFHSASVASFPANLTFREVAIHMLLYQGRSQHNLQDSNNRRDILADTKMEPVFGKKKMTMFEVNKHPFFWSGDAHCAQC